jgi:hypothetical protein
MKTLLIAVAVIVLMIGAQSAFAISAFESGFRHGLIDGRQSDTTQWYILQPNNGFANHTKQFDRGYVTGWCSVNPIFSGSDEDQASFNCRVGPDSVAWLISGPGGVSIQ